MASFSTWKDKWTKIIVQWTGKERRKSKNHKFFYSFEKP
jgi:hypothetical protein